MIRNGVLPGFLNMRLGVGSAYGDDHSNRAKLPPTEYYLDAALGHHKAMMEHGLYEKMNKFIVCPMDCFTYGGDIGIIEMAGNTGKWLSDSVPAESNWLAHFVASLESPTLSK